MSFYAVDKTDKYGFPCPLMSNNTRESGVNMLSKNSGHKGDQV